MIETLEETYIVSYWFGEFNFRHNRPQFFSLIWIVCEAA